jgi:gamma-glutamyltranspeptidase/glutathione hydrolase
MLEQGGNAVDAAVAAAFASFIAETGVVHLGGSGLAQIYDPATQRSVVYDFFSAMPGLGANGYGDRLDFEKVTIDFGATTQDFHLGRGAVAVPGNVFGLCRLAADFGRLPLETLLQPALKLAREGAVLDAFQADTCELLRPLYMHTAGVRQVFAPEGRMVRAGDRIFIPDLADTLSELARQGEAYIRSGALAQTIVEDQRANGGLLTAQDLESYEVGQLEPVRIRYRDYEVFLPPPCSSGGVLIAFALKLLSHFDVGAYKHGSAHHLSLLFEIMAATTRARPEWDRLSVSLPADAAIRHFLDDGFVGRYVNEVSEAIAARNPAIALPEDPGPGNTSHLSVMDEEGMAVGLTTTAGETAGYVVPGTGFIPNNILGEEDLNPHGFHNWPAGQRIPTMMAPTFVSLNGRIRLVVGSGGSIRIRSAILQTLSNLLDFDMKLETAVNVARVHVENGVLQCEAGYDPAAVDQLESWGYPVNRWRTRSIYFGGAHSVARTEAGRLTAAGDSRRGGATNALV